MSIIITHFSSCSQRATSALYRSCITVLVDIGFLLLLLAMTKRKVLRIVALISYGAAAEVAILLLRVVVEGDPLTGTTLVVFLIVVRLALFLSVFVGGIWTTVKGYGAIGCLVASASYTINLIVVLGYFFS